jgi:hypothetical protein
LDSLPVGFEGFWIKALGKVVGLLILGVDLVGLELMLVVMAPEPVELEQEVLSVVGDPLVPSKVVGALIVLEGVGLDSRSEFLGKLHHRDELLDEALEGERLEGVESAVYSASRVEREISVCRKDFHRRGTSQNGSNKPARE